MYLYILFLISLSLPFIHNRIHSLHIQVVRWRKTPIIGVKEITRTFRPVLQPHYTEPLYVYVHMYRLYIVCMYVCNYRYIIHLTRWAHTCTCMYVHVTIDTHNYNTLNKVGPVWAPPTIHLYKQHQQYLIDVVHEYSNGTS